MRKVYLDSCIVIYLIQGTEEVSQAIRSAIEPGEGDPPSICFSDLTRLECRVGPLRQGDGELLSQFDRLFSSRDLDVVTLDSQVFDLATDLRALHGTKTPDAIHLAAAVHSGCTEFWTNDLRLRGPASGRIEIRVFG